MVLVRSFSYIPDASFSEEFLLHSSGHAGLVRSFLYTPRAGFIEEFLWDTHRARFSEEFLLHPSSCFQWGVSLTLLELVLVKSFSYISDASFRSFSYTPRAGFSEEFLLHSSGHAVLVRSFSYTPRVMLF